MSKILLIDIDGTLVDYENRLPASAVEAIRKARANGHKVYLCSGRSKAENKQEIWDIGIDGYIGGNGSYVESDGAVVMHQLITADQCRRIVDWLDVRGLEFYLESNNGLFATWWCPSWPSMPSAKAARPAPIFPMSRPSRA